MLSYLTYYIMNATKVTLENPSHYSLIVNGLWIFILIFMISVTWFTYSRIDSGDQTWLLIGLMVSFGLNIVGLIGYAIMLVAKKRNKRKKVYQND